MELPDLSEVDKRVVEYTKGALATANPAPAANPHERQLADLLRRVNENVAFGQTSVTDGAKEFISQGSQILKSS